MDDERKQLSCCCDQNEVSNIIACLCEFKNTITCVLECFDDHSSGIKERIILCLLLDEIRRIEAKLDNPLFGLNEIKHEIIDINNIITNTTFGLREIKNEVRDVDNLLNNQFFGLNEIKNEIITINDLLTNTTFGIPELKNEIRVIENRTGRTINLLTNQIFGLNEIKNEVRNIENIAGNLPSNLSISIISNTVNIINNTINNNIFGLNEIKNEIRLIENNTALLTNEQFGLNEIKNEIRLIENQTVLLTNEIFGLNEIKNEIRAMENRIFNLPLPGSSTLLTTGPVRLDNNAQNFVFKVINTSPNNAAVNMIIWNYDVCTPNGASCFNQQNFIVRPNCANEIDISIGPSPSNYEVTVSGVVPGVYVYTTTYGTLLSGLSLPANTFRYSEFAPRVFNRTCP